MGNKSRDGNGINQTQYDGMRTKWNRPLLYSDYSVTAPLICSVYIYIIYTHACMHACMHTCIHTFHVVDYDHFFSELYPTTDT